VIDLEGANFAEAGNMNPRIKAPDSVEDLNSIEGAQQI
jgi:hypothetical protein